MCIQGVSRNLTEKKTSKKLTNQYEFNGARIMLIGLILKKLLAFQIGTIS
jgi:hypothetical protein